MKHYFKHPILSVAKFPPQRHWGEKNKQRKQTACQNQSVSQLRGKQEVHSSRETIRRATLSRSCCNSGRDETLAHTRANCQKLGSYQRESTKIQTAWMGRTLKMHRGKTQWQCCCTNTPAKKETCCSYQHLHARVQNKKVSTRANEAKRKQGKLFGSETFGWSKQSTPSPEALQIAAFSIYQDIYRLHTQR